MCADFRACLLRCFVAVSLILLIEPVIATAQPVADIGRTFSGSPSFFWDADAAVGPNHYAEITNAGLRVTTLSGVVAYSASLSQFWSTKVGLPLLPGPLFDSRLDYDHATGRFIAVSLSGARRPDSAIYVGISDTSDPSQGWKGLVIDADPSDLRWADFPYLGVDGAAVYITTGMPGIDSATASRLALFVLPKSDLTAATPTAARLSRFLTMYPTAPGSDYYFIAPAQIDYLGTATDGLLISGFEQPTFVATGSGNQWVVNTVYQRMTGQASGPATLLPWATTPSYQFESASNPPPQPLPSDFGRQPGTAFRLNNGGGNDRVRVGDTLYTATSAPVQGRLGILWRRFKPSTNTIVDAGFIGDDVSDYLSPSIAVNTNGDVVVAYARTSPTEFASFYFSAGRPDANGKLVFGPRTLVKAGSDIYDENGSVKAPGIARFVDYASAVSVHPSAPSRFWISGPYVNARNNGAIWIAEIIVRAGFTDDPIVPNTTAVKLIHISELRTRIDAARVAAGLAPYSYTDSTMTAQSTVIKAVHVTDLRTALADVYVARERTPPSYADPSLGSGSSIRAIHINELRSALAAIE
jgi:hypothetical protein